MVNLTQKADKLDRVLWRIGLVGAGLMAGLSGMVGGLVTVALCCLPPATIIVGTGTVGVGIGAGLLAWAGDASRVLLPPLIFFSVMAAYGGLRMRQRVSRYGRCREPEPPRRDHQGGD